MKNQKEERRTRLKIWFGPGLALDTLPMLLVKENRILAKSIALIFSLFGFILEKETGVVWQALL